MNPQVQLTHRGHTTQVQPSANPLRSNGAAWLGSYSSPSMPVSVLASVPARCTSYLSDQLSSQKDSLHLRSGRRGMESLHPVLGVHLSQARWHSSLTLASIPWMLPSAKPFITQPRPSLYFDLFILTSYFEKDSNAHLHARNLSNPPVGPYMVFTLRRVPLFMWGLILKETSG